MDQSDTEHFRSRLLALRDSLRLTEIAARQAALPVELDQSRVGRLARVDAMQGQALAQEALRRREVLDNRIERALRRIEAGAYGSCDACDKGIARQRLEADPTATLCITCASARETR